MVATVGKPKGLQEYPWQWGYDAAVLGRPQINPYDESKPREREEWAEGYELGWQMRQQQEKQA